MEITEVRIKLMESAEDRLRGFCSITFDGCFVVRDLKIIEGHNGAFVAMPSRKLSANCGKCRTKNHLRAHYCNNCGQKLRADQMIQHDSGGRAKLYADIAHPINAGCREMIQKRVIEELEKEVELSKQPGYRSRYDEAYDDGYRGGNPRKSSNKTENSSNGQSGRKDDRHAKSATPHQSQKEEQKQHQKNDGNDRDVSSGRSKPHSGDFGQGIFE